MHDLLKQRLLRRLETLPEERIYQVLDYIEFLESRYNRGAPDQATMLQRMAERLEDGLRRRTVNPANVREAFQIISAADRVITSVSTASRRFIADLQVPPEAAGAADPEGEGEGSARG